MTEFKRIPPEHAQTLRENGAVVVDIRDPQTYALNHIKAPSTWTTTTLPTSSAPPTWMRR